MPRAAGRWVAECGQRQTIPGPGQVTAGDIGMPFAGHLPTLDLGLSYPGGPIETADNLALLWKDDLGEASVLQRAQIDPAAWNEASLRWLVDPPQSLIGD